MLTPDLLMLRRRLSRAASPPEGAVTRITELPESGTADGDRVIGLTFDDGPSPEHTPEILAILDRHDLRASFFVLGEQAALHPDLVRAAAAAGHTIGSHSWSHTRLDSIDATRLGEEVDRSGALLEALSGRAVRHLRPPYGRCDAHTVRLLAARGLVTVLWTIDPHDWARPGVTRIVRRTLAELHPGGLVLLHDGGGDRSQTVAALPRLIEAILSRGYRMLPLVRP